MNTNINELLSLTGFELAKLGDQFEAKYGYESDTSNTEDVTKLLTMNTQTPSNAGVAFEMQALGFGPTNSNLTLYGYLISKKMN